MITITSPTTVPEFRRLANAFLSGSRFPSGTQVYVVASTRGLRPINKIIPVDSPTAEADVQAALADTAPVGFSNDEERGNQVTYRVTVPDVSRLNQILIGPHGATGCLRVRRRAGSDPMPGDAVLGNIASTSLHITWNDDTTTIYDFPPETDAVAFTRGAVELFGFPVYQAIYGDDYVQQLKDSLGIPLE
jgi:hypothetical protein